MTSKITYLGDLRTSSIHLESGTEILSDAPKDNYGKGEAFSPTDLVANALGSCMMTIMAVKANTMNIDLTNSTIEVTKIMQTEPRKIARIVITMNMSIALDEKSKNAAFPTQDPQLFNCPQEVSDAANQN